jgi:excisionase family DNA binding protein
MSYLSVTETNAHLMTVDEVTAMLRCHRITVLRLIRRGVLHTLMIARAIRFERAEVRGVSNRKIAVYPHLALVRPASLAKRILKPVVPISS